MLGALRWAEMSVLSEVEAWRGVERAVGPADAAGDSREGDRRETAVHAGARATAGLAESSGEGGKCLAQLATGQL